MAAFLSFVFIALTLAPRAFGENLVFKARGKEVSSYNLPELKGKVSPIVLTIFDELEGKEATFQALPLVPLLKAIYGDSWAKTEEVLFAAADGYKAAVAMNRIKKYRALLAFERVGGPFVARNRYQNNERVELGPYFLIWDNLNNEPLRKEGPKDLPYQVVSLDLVDFSDRFPNVVPAANSSLRVKQGFAVYRRYCMTCHGINREGGTKAPELNTPKSVTETMDEARLRQWILNPRSLVPTSLMPSFKDNGDYTPEKLDNLVLYLKERASHKVP